MRDLPKKVHGIVVRGAPTGNGVFKRSWLAAKAHEIRSRIEKPTQVFSLVRQKPLIW
jgi:hypothetical protein